MDELKILIADDEQPARKKILSFLKDESGEYIVKEAANGIEAAELIDEFNPDLILLDIQMPGLNGFELIETIGADKMPAIIFTTAFDQYAIDAFEVNAIDYLLKPFDSSRFQKSFRRALSEINLKKQPEKLITNLLGTINKEKKPLNKFIVKKGQKYIFVPAADVYYLTAEDKYVQISTEKESFLIRDSITNIENRLDADVFKKVHRSALVNVNYVKEIQPWSHGDFIIILSNGKKINATRKYRDSIFGTD